MSRKHAYKKKQTVSNVTNTSAQTYAHKCIKCKTDYSDLDFEDYLCDDCNAARLAVAREIDAKFNTVGQVPNSDLTTYMAAVKANKGQGFPSIGQMGIKWT